MAMLETCTDVSPRPISNGHRTSEFNISSHWICRPQGVCRRSSQGIKTPTGASSQASGGAAEDVLVSLHLRMVREFPPDMLLTVINVAQPKLLLSRKTAGYNL